jgi:cyanate permease
MKKYCHIPFAPSRIPFFFGWVILAAGTLGILMSIPGQTMGVSVFTENLLSDLDIDRNYLSLAYLIGTVGSGLMITRAGKYYDRYGARIMGLAAAGMLGLSLLYLTSVESVSTFVNGMISWVSPALATFILLSVGFWGIRFFGQGMLTMVSRNMVMKWFDKRRGMANAILGIFAAFGFSLAPKVLDMFIDRRSWTGTWLMLGIVIGLGFVMFVFLFYRDNPENCGCRADGNMPVRQKGKRPPSLPDRNYTLKEARGTFSFWVFTLGLAIAALYISGMTFHVVSVFDTVGIDKHTAINIFVPASLIAIVVQFIASYLSDFIRLKYLLLVFLAGMMLTTTGLILLTGSSIPFWMIITGNGITWGLFTVLIAVVWPRFYGLEHLGAISGYSLSWTVIASALGPYFFSRSLDLTGNYHMIGIVSLGISTILLVLAFRADNPSEV